MKYELIKNIGKGTMIAHEVFAPDSNAYKFYTMISVPEFGNVEPLNKWKISLETKKGKRVNIFYTGKMVHSAGILNEFLKTISDEIKEYLISDDILVVYKAKITGTTFSG